MMDADLQYLLDTTREAGRLAMGYFGLAKGELKGDGTLFSQADTEAEALTRARIGSRWPDDAIVGEEFAGAEDICEGRAWIIDPVDGTLNFLFGLPLWCVSVGLTERGRPVMGAIYAPGTDELWYAQDGAGAWLNGARIRATAEEHLHANLLFGSDSDVLDRVRLSLPPRKRNVGSSAMHACYVAQGTFCGTIYAQWGLWDIAAGLCIAKEAGAPAWRRDGSELPGLGEYCATRKVRETIVICPPQLAAATLQGVSDQG
jgi:myo-inositol-1(or 4)-monophosphatase